MKSYPFFLLSHLRRASSARRPFFVRKKPTAHLPSVVSVGAATSRLAGNNPPRQHTNHLRPDAPTYKTGACRVQRQAPVSFKYAFQYPSSSPSQERIWPE